MLGRYVGRNLGNLGKVNIQDVMITAVVTAIVTAIVTKAMEKK